MRSTSDLSSGKRSMGSSNSTSHAKSERREVCSDCSTLLPMIQSIDCRKYEKHENHVSYKIKEKNHFFLGKHSISDLEQSISNKTPALLFCGLLQWAAFTAWIVSRHRNFVIFINFLKLNWLDTHIPIYERQKQGNVSISSN